MITYLLYHIVATNLLGNAAKYGHEGGRVLLATEATGAFAQATVTFPKRLVIFYTPNGVNPGAWFPTPGSNESNFIFNRAHAALAPFRSKLILTSGIDMVAADDGPGSHTVTVQVTDSGGRSATDDEGAFAFEL